MQQPAVEAVVMAFNENRVGAIDTTSFVFSENLHKLHIIPANDDSIDEKSAIRAYGHALMACITSSHTQPKRLIKIATDCINGHIDNFNDLHLALERRMSNTIYIPLIIILALLFALLWWLNSTYGA